MSRVVPVHDAELLLDAQAELGEGPVWDPASSCLFFVDILRGHVKRFYPATGALQAFDVGQYVGAVALAPGLAAPAAVAFTDVGLAWRAVVVGLLSSVVPYALEQVVLRRVGAATFSVLMALLPATAAVVGALGLQQVPTAGELAGLACVTGALLMTGQLRRRTPPGQPPLV